MNIVQRYITQNPCYTRGIWIKPKGAFLHSIGCPCEKAENIRAGENRTDAEAGVHAVIQRDGLVMQLLPINFGERTAIRNWHAGSGNAGNSNDMYIGIEMCEPESIKYTGGASWKEERDGTNTKAHVLETYKVAVEYFAYLCKGYGWDPLKDGVILSHSEGYKRGIATNHADVEHLWNHFGISMAQFRKDIKKQLSGSNAAETGTKITGKATATAEQMQKYIRSKNPSVAQSVLDMVPQYIQEGKTESIRGDIAFAQSCLETGNFTFKDSAVTLDQNNFCGMGVTANGMKGNSFPNSKTGIRAQIQHLKAYACTEPLQKECVDPRFNFVERGCAEYVEWLGIQENPKGKGWAAGSGYGSKILNILESITGTKEEQPKPTPAPQPEPDQAGTYRVQAGSYKDKKLANSLATVLKDKGFDAIVKEETGQYKVQCGVFSNKKNADILARQIKGAGFDAIVKGTDNSIWVGKCTGDGVNVRKGPGENYGNIAGYPKLNTGNLVDVINKESGWYQILIDKRYSGFISEQYIEKA